MRMFCGHRHVRLNAWIRKESSQSQCPPPSTWEEEIIADYIAQPGTRARKCRHTHERFQEDAEADQYRLAFECYHWNCDEAGSPPDLALQ
jgi:hypothetical protein